MMGGKLTGIQSSQFSDPKYICLRHLLRWLVILIGDRFIGEPMSMHELEAYQGLTLRNTRRCF